MAQHAPLPSLPTCAEYDPLDDHFDELEGSGANLLQDFILGSNKPSEPTSSSASITSSTTTSSSFSSSSSSSPPPVNYNLTPLSTSAGYTSEESDSTLTTPSDEQTFGDMSFLQYADTNELADVVADFCGDDDLTKLSPQQQRVFGGKVIGGKTSKYRGVTQTSKSSWGAKYSAKRITNTCKTQDEAARAYDNYIRTHHPEKYPKFANFCLRCDRFVNPLGLEAFTNECQCSNNTNNNNNSDGSPLAPTTPETDREDMDVDMDLGGDGEPLPGWMNAVAGVAAAVDAEGGQLSLGFLDNDHADLMDNAVNDRASSMGKKDSLSLAAVESLAADGGLDRILSDIDRSSLPKRSSSLSNGGVPDFSAEEWNNLSQYIQSDPEGIANVLEQNANERNQQQYVAPPSDQQNSSQNGYKKIHSLDFDNNDGSARPKHMHKIHSLEIDGPDTEGMATIKDEYASAMDVDDLASVFLPPPTPMDSFNDMDLDMDLVTSTSTHSMISTAPSTPGRSVVPVSQTKSSAAFPARVNIITPFLEKYWRNDRKNIQCFPFCPEHGDYYRVRIEDLSHSGKGVCRAPVKAQVVLPMSQTVNEADLLVFARCNSTFSRNVALAAQPSLNADEMKALQSVSAVGIVDSISPLADGYGVQFNVTFQPDVWKFEFDLPKKRRHTGNGDGDQEGGTSEFMYFFEIDLFVALPSHVGGFQRVGHAESMNFQIANTRTLQRERNRIAGSATQNASAEEVLTHHAEQYVHNGIGGDADRILPSDDLPYRKKVRLHVGQKALTGSIDEGDGVVDRTRSSSYITGEGFENTNAKVVDPHQPVDVDKLCRIDSKDSLFDIDSSGVLGAPAGVRSEQVWTDAEDGVQQEPTSYDRYVSPRNKPEPQTAIAIARKSVDIGYSSQPQPVQLPNAAEKHDWGKLVGYSAVCVPMAFILLPVALVLLLPFILLPPLSGSIVRVLDTLSDMELRRANSSCIDSDTRLVLRRLDANSSAAKKNMFAYHGQGAVWSRFLYFGGGKLLYSMVIFVPVLLLTVMGLVLYPVRPVSQALLRSATSLALSLREYTRKSVGKPFGTSLQTPAYGDALV